MGMRPREDGRRPIPRMTDPSIHHEPVGCTHHQWVQLTREQREDLIAEQRRLSGYARKDPVVQNPYPQREQNPEEKIVAEIRTPSSREEWDEQIDAASIALRQRGRELDAAKEEQSHACRWDRIAAVVAVFGFVVSTLCGVTAFFATAWWIAPAVVFGVISGAALVGMADGSDRRLHRQHVRQASYALEDALDVYNRTMLKEVSK